MGRPQIGPELEQALEQAMGSEVAQLNREFRQLG
jgi:hypothetical protein